jgi:quercetin dioxygenase-like cupin family protein
MHKVTIGASLILAAGIAAAIGGQVPYAAEKKEVYVSTAELTTLLDKALPGVDGMQITIVHGTVPPGWVGGKHYHTGPVYVYVLEGSFAIEEQGKPPQTFKAGELYQEPIGTPMQARNMSTSEPTKILAIQVNRQGEPMMYKAE